MASLTTSGTPTANGDSTVTINSTGADRVQAPASLIDETQAWFVARLVEPTIDTLRHHALGWGLADLTEVVRLYRGTTAQGGKWRMSRRTSNAGGEATIPSGVSEGTDATVAGKWTSTNVYVSANGATFTSAANTNIPVLAATSFDVGQLVADHYIQSKIYWCAGGTGTLSDADIAALHLFGNSDPAWTDFPGGSALTFLWKCNDFTYEDSGAVSVGASGMTLLGVG